MASSADLAIGAMLEDSIPPHLEALPTNIGLPDLGHQKINMYGANTSDEVHAQLAEIIRQGFQGSQPMLVRQA